MELQIKYVKNVPRLTYIGGISDWIDLCAAEDVEMKAREYKAIPLGVALKLPVGYEALVVPRSSTFKRYGVLMANSVGVIDNSYCGDKDEWHFPVYATRDVEIKAGSRICQFRVMENQPRLEFVEVDKLGTSRGGIGSTGV